MGDQLTDVVQFVVATWLEPAARSYRPFTCSSIVICIGFPETKAFCSLSFGFPPIFFPTQMNGSEM